MSANSALGDHMYDLYSSSSDDRLRLILGQSGTKKLFVIGLNPSTATKEKSDTTVAKVQEVARLNGYNGFVMLNLYPVRATDYNTLPQEQEHAAMEQNLSEIEASLAGEIHPTVWVAWGTSILARPFFGASAMQLATRLHRYEPEWLHYGQLTAEGHPKHPSRLSYSWSFAPFDINTYIKRISAGG